MSNNRKLRRRPGLATTLLALLGASSVCLAGPYAYVWVPGAYHLASIDTATSSIVGSPIAVRTATIGGAVSPSGQRIYLVSYDYRQHIANGWLTVVDARTRSVVASLELAVDPLRVAVSPDEKTVYVTHVNGGPIVVIDAATVTRTAQLSGARSHSVVFSPDGRRFYATDSTEPGAIVGYDSATNAVLQRIALERYPEEIDVSPDGRFLYVTHGLDDKVSIVDTEAGTLLKTLPIRANAVAASPDGRRVYFVAELSSAVVVVDTNSHNPLASVPVGLGPVAVSVTPDSKAVYVPSSNAVTVSVIDAATLNVSTISGLGGSFKGRFIGPSPTAAALENPQPASFQSGIGLISGWACAGPIAVSVDGAAPIAVPQGSPRGDTLGECGTLSGAAGFGLLTNFNLLGSGTHSAQLFLNGTPLGNPLSFTVTRPAGEFLRGASKETVVNDFPVPGKSTTLIWQEAQQNFAIKAVSP